MRRASLCGGTEELLLVEDDPAVRASTASALRRAGYRVATSASGAEALALLATGSIRPTAMVSDVVMPGMSGPELAARIAEDRPEMRVVFMSGYADDDLLMEGLERHAINFVSKPFTRSELLQAVRRALDTPSTVA